MNDFPPGTRIRPIELPYLDQSEARTRLIPILPFFDDVSKEWALFIREDSDLLVRVAGGEVVTGTYLAKQCENPSKDYALNFFTFIFQHISSERTFKLVDRLVNDIHNMSSILEKYLILSSLASSQNTKAGMYQLMISEVEYLVMLIRAYFDLFQKIAKELTSLVFTFDTPQRRLIANLPDSFADVVLVNGENRSASDIEKKYRLPKSLASFYESEAESFTILRKIRVAIEHHGMTPTFILGLDKGLAVPIDLKPWNSLNIWSGIDIEENNLGPLRLVFLTLIQNALLLPNRFVEAYKTCIAVSPPIAPGWQVYFRDYYSQHLVKLPKNLEAPWENTKGATR